jgi:protein-disulfide isomerase-like protein with CxxC motif
MKAPSTSQGLRLTLALLMMDACTGRVCSLQRVGSFCGQRSLSASGSRFMNGPLGPSYGGDNGSALLMIVSDFYYPAANCVNAGARVGLRLLKGGKDSKYSNQVVIKVATFASRLWRTINGEKCDRFTSSENTETFSVCAHDTHLRCALVALWQCLWPSKCTQLMRAQSWHVMEGTPQYSAMGLDKVLKQTLEEKESTDKEEEVLKPLSDIVDVELERQKWRGDMAAKAYEYYERENRTSQAEIGQPLPIVEKNGAWKLGGWVASTAQQRREKNLDGGRAVRKINLHVQSKSSVEA